MPLSILVADDSSIARKMLIKALPPHWDISISQAADGQQALAACRQGDIDVMFLDLTMPVLDGYAVLQAHRDEDLNGLIIVVSADIQEQAQIRVRDLGAIAFIQKPVDAGKIERVLKEYGIQL
ncbi:response regulator [Silvimonas sp. JCM 19000]